MAIGKRIEQRLKDLGWGRKELLDRVDNLTPQALSNLILRDSKRSEWDEALADALNVDLLWLVYGKEPAAYGQNKKVTRLMAAQPQPGSKTLKDLIDTAEKMSPEGQLVLLGRAQELAGKYPKAKAKPFQLILFPDCGAQAKTRRSNMPHALPFKVRLGTLAPLDQLIQL